MTDAFTIDTLMDVARRLSRTKPLLVGIVCRPELVGYMRQLVTEETASVVDPTLRRFCEPPVYTKTDQVEPYRPFYDHNELRRYLNP